MTIEEFNRVLTYEPETGNFYWLVDRARIRAGTKAGYTNPRGYIKIKTGGKSYFAHRLAFLFMNKVYPTLEVDHINRITGDNRFINLRLCTHQENCLNFPVYKTSTSGLTGVRVRPNGRWRAFARINKKEVSIGTYSSKEEAYAARVDFINTNPDAYGNN